MKKELYFDIVADDWAGGLYCISIDAKITGFNYHCSMSDLETNVTTSSETDYPGFTEFWQAFTLDKKWFILHPLFIHPDQRKFIREELSRVNWKVIADEKWREMYQRQWNKVLNSAAEYYTPPAARQL